MTFLGPRVHALRHALLDRALLRVRDWKMDERRDHCQKHANAPLLTLVKGFSQQTQASGKQRIIIIMLRLFLPCFLLVAFLDVRTLRFLRSTIHISGAANMSTTGTDTPSTANADEEGASEYFEKPIEVSTADMPNVDTSKELNTQTSKNTTTTCLDPQGPQPYILLARGRSGSVVLCKSLDH